MNLKLRAEDTEDLKVMSAHLQDALIRMGDIVFLARKRRLAIVLNRFCWEREPGRINGKDAYERTAAGLHLDNVLSVKTRGMDRSDPEALLYMLAIDVKMEQEGEALIELQFAGNASLIARVECIEMQLEDMGEPWLTDSKPAHDGARTSSP